ncbi:hypothetical protein CEXT_528781 [Caerostris extrusa]|uniref:Uncharacterized protein n=1 Tax=Caerostris extrusa TaxID=172846 RepID=A0AAV4YD99_CAEEX|nr:hypothetical protein CEXT_528781 [Caerostris extrusa]
MKKGPYFDRTPETTQLNSLAELLHHLTTNISFTILNSNRIDWTLCYVQQNDCPNETKILVTCKIWQYLSPLICQWRTFGSWQAWGNWGENWQPLQRYGAASAVLVIGGHKVTLQIFRAVACFERNTRSLRRERKLILSSALPRAQPLAAGTRGKLKAHQLEQTLPGVPA